MAIRASYDDKDIGRRASGLSKKLNDFKWIGEAIEDVVLDYFMEHLESEGGGEWEPLSPEYHAWKRYAYPGQAILRREDKLYESLTNTSAPYNVRRLYAHGGEWGTSHPAARFHQEGTNTMPAREIIVLDDSNFRRDVNRALRNTVVRQIRLS